MKKILFIFVSLVVTAMCYAQSTMMATLSHEGKIQVYYGAYALKEAHTAAAGGDVITLSTGTFVSTDITKPITLRGAGAALDTITRKENTILTGDFNVKVKNTDKARLTFEGFYHTGQISIKDTLENATFLKCKFSEINGLNTKVYDLKMIQCIVSKKLGFASNSTLVFINSVLPGANYGSGYSPIYSCQNCIITDNVGYLKNSEFRNCIFSRTTQSTSNILSSTCVAYNCISFNSYTFKNSLNKTNQRIQGGYSAIFKSYNGTYVEEEMYELTDSAKAVYKGADGREVGLYGGNLSFDMIPTNPRIVKCDVAGKTTSDGKLSVDIEVRSAQ